jgi:hypothetical protein
MAFETPAKIVANFHVEYYGIPENAVCMFKEYLASYYNTICVETFVKYKRMLTPDEIYSDIPKTIAILKQKYPGLFNGERFEKYLETIREFKDCTELPLLSARPRPCPVHLQIPGRMQVAPRNLSRNNNQERRAVQQNISPIIDIDLGVPWKRVLEGDKEESQKRAKN